MRRSSRPRPEVWRWVLCQKLPFSILPTSFSLKSTLRYFREVLVPGNDGHLIALQDTLLAWRPNTRTSHPTSNDRHRPGANSITQSSTASTLNSRRVAGGRSIYPASTPCPIRPAMIPAILSSPNEPAQCNNPHIVPNPVDVADLIRLVQEQLRALRKTHLALPTGLSYIPPHRLSGQRHLHPAEGRRGSIAGVPRNAVERVPKKS